MMSKLTDAFGIPASRGLGRTRKPNRFDNLSDEHLADDFGSAADAAKRHRALRNEVIARGKSKIHGDKYVVFASTKHSTVFNHARCRALLGDEAYEALWEITETMWVQAGRLVDDETEE